jgi:fumarate reductase (CoM/CoB) subunit A
MEFLRTDVLVIGAGAAGARSALEAARFGARTLLITKGRLGTSGASAYGVADAAGFGASGFVDPTDSPAIHLEDILRAAQGMADPVLAGIVAAEAPRHLLFLQNLGVPIQRAGDGYLATRSCFSSRPRSIKIKGHGRPIVECLRTHLFALTNVRVLEHAVVTDPVLEGNGRCVGALARDESGRRFGILAGATILATGGAGRLFDLSLNPSDITGDGYAFGLRAGAELVNLEFMQAGFGILGPRAHAIFQYWLWDLQPTLATEVGVPFLHRFIPDGLPLESLMAAKARHFPFSVSDISGHLEIGVQSFINQERDQGREGAVWMSLTDVEERVRALPEVHNLKRMWSLSRELLLSAGIELTTRFRVAPFAHAMNGGLAIDQFARTTVDGLYAVGEVAGGPHGADRLGGNMFPTGQIFGERAGLHAAAFATSHPVEGASRDSCASSARPTCAPAGQDLESLEALHQRLQRQASRSLLIVRETEPLRRLLATIAEMEEQVARRDRTSESPAALAEMQSLLLTGKAMAVAALLREESRGGHYRKDFPVRSETWSRRIFLRLDTQGAIATRLA